APTAIVRAAETATASLTVAATVGSAIPECPLSGAGAPNGGAPTSAAWCRSALLPLIASALLGSPARKPGPPASPDRAGHRRARAPRAHRPSASHATPGDTPWRTRGRLRAHADGRTR